MKISRIAIVFGILICLGSFSMMAQTVRIGGDSLRANGQLAQGFQYTGSCPVNLKFGWGLISTGPATVNYSFVRNDGGHSSNSQSVNIPQANHSVPVYDSWQLGANTPQFANYTGWVKILIDSPNQIEGKIGFTIHCQMAQTVRIGGESLRANGQLAQGFQYTGSCPVNLQFGWGLISTEPTAVNYSFVRNDGGHSSNSQSVNIPQANHSVPVYDSWQLGANTPQFANYTGWVKSLIYSPNQVEWKIGFTIHCK